VRTDRAKRRRLRSYRMWAIAFSLACTGLAHAGSSGGKSNGFGQIEQVIPRALPRLSLSRDEALATDERWGDNATLATRPIERPDCLLEADLCRSNCYYADDEQQCAIRECEPQLKLCIASLPFGAPASLPAACSPADQSAFRKLGPPLDIDPKLLAGAQDALIRARISCKAGFFDHGLRLYQEIETILHRK
jgi:hypothetical protein